MRFFNHCKIAFISGLLLLSANANGLDKIVQTPGKVEVFGTIDSYQVTPKMIEVEAGDELTVHLTNLEPLQAHKLVLYGKNVIAAGKIANFRLIADKPGIYPYFCSKFCSSVDLESDSYLIIKPKGFKPISQSPHIERINSKTAYDKSLNEIQTIQGLIDELLGNLKNIVLKKQAINYLTFAKLAADKSEAAAKKLDWNNAELWLNQWRQYQLMAANLVLIAPSTELPPENSLETQANKQLLKNLAQQAAIHENLWFIFQHNYYEFTDIATLIKKALKVLTLAKAAENHTKAAAKQANWTKTISEAKRWQDYLIQANEIILNAKAALLKQAGAKQILTAVVTRIQQISNHNE
jgi:plastocyanin